MKNSLKRLKIVKKIEIFLNNHITTCNDLKRENNVMLQFVIVKAKAFLAVTFRDITLNVRHT